MTGAERWDRDLSAEEVKGLSPADRGRRAVASLERKVARVEAEARRVAPGDPMPDVPADRAKLRRWTDPAAGLWPWADPQVDHPGRRNACLVRRFHEALETIRLRRRGGRRALRGELDARDRRIAELERQAAHLVGENRHLCEQVAACLSRLAG